MTQRPRAPVARAISRMLRRPVDERTTLLAAGGLAAARVLAEVAASPAPVAASELAALLTERFAFLLWLHTAITVLLRRLLPPPVHGAGTLVSIGLILALLSPLLGMTLGLAPPQGMPWIEGAQGAALPASVVVALIALPIAVAALVRARTTSWPRTCAGALGMAAIIVGTLAIPVLWLAPAGRAPDPWTASLVFFAMHLIALLLLRSPLLPGSTRAIGLAFGASVAVGAMQWRLGHPLSGAVLAACAVLLTLWVTARREPPEPILVLGVTHVGVLVALAHGSPALALGLLGLVLARLLPAHPSPHVRTALTGLSLVLLATWAPFTP